MRRALKWLGGLLLLLLVLAVVAVIVGPPKVPAEAIANSVDRTPARPADAALQSVRFDNAAPAGALAFAQGGLGSNRQLAFAAALALLALALLRPGWAR